MQFCIALALCLQANPPAVQRLEIPSGNRVLTAPHATQQLAVIAHFSNGASRDVTRLTVFTSSDNDVAEVNDKGLVTFRRTGDVAILCRYLTITQTVRLGYAAPKPGYRWPDPPEVNFVDKHVFGKLKQLSIAPSELCTDTQFMRRAYLDACAALPTPEEARKFLADPDKDKRAKLIDRLLDRPEYADAWTYHWADALAFNPERLGRKNAIAYQLWIYDHVAKNTPVDRVVRELLTSQGHSEKHGAVNFFRGHDNPAQLAEHTASVFLGMRLQCAGCHADVAAPWTPADYHGFVAFFAQVTRKGTKEPGAEYIALAPKSAWLHPQTRKIVPAQFLGGAPVRFKEDQDHREVFADWLTAADNPFFAKVFVNRVWSNLFGRGIVEPVDDFRFTNPPANDALLDALAADFVKHGYDHKRLIRTIMNSRTYQLSSSANEHNKTDERFFSRRAPSWLYPEQLHDAVTSALEAAEQIPGYPAGTRAVQAPGAFGPAYFLDVGRPPRPPHWEYARAPRWENVQLSVLLLERKLQERFKAPKNRVTRLLAKKVSDKEMTEELFLATLSRLPRADEMETVRKHLERDLDRRRIWEDVLWALLNTREFTRRL